MVNNYSIMKKFKMFESDQNYIVKHKDNSIYRFKVYPLDISKDKPKKEYVLIAAETLKSELQKEGYIKPRNLLGRCHKNSVSLFKNLLNYGYNPKLVIGANTASGPYASITESFNNIKNIHQWVELNGYTVEICSESVQSVGKLYVSDRKPNNYSKYIDLTPSEYKNLDLEYITSDTLYKITNNR